MAVAHILDLQTNTAFWPQVILLTASRRSASITRIPELHRSPHQVWYINTRAVLCVVRTRSGGQLPRFRTLATVFDVHGKRSRLSRTWCRAIVVLILEPAIDSSRSNGRDQFEVCQELSVDRSIVDPIPGSVREKQRSERKGMCFWHCPKINRNLIAIVMFSQLDGAFDEALKAGFSTAYEYSQLWLARCAQIRRLLASGMSYVIGRAGKRLCNSSEWSRA